MQSNWSNCSLYINEWERSDEPFLCKRKITATPPPPITKNSRVILRPKGIDKMESPHNMKGRKVCPN